MKKIKSILCVLLVLVMLLSIAACSGGSTPDAGTTTPDQAETSDNSANSDSGDINTPDAPVGSSRPSSVAIGLTGSLGRFLDGATPMQNRSACDAVYDTLFLTDKRTMDKYSNILESWGYEDDFTFVMTLKPGVIFSNGEEATADDLLFSVTNHFERMSSNTKALGGAALDVDNCKTDGDYSVIIKYTEAYGPGLMANTIYLYNESWCREKGWDAEEWFTDPCGSGPFKVTEYVIDDHMTLQLRDNYWNAANVKFDIEEWIIRYYPDPAMMYMALELGDISLCPVTNMADYSRYLSQGGIENVGMNLDMMGDVTVFTMAYENNDIFLNKEVRKALAHGIDWESLSKLYIGDLYIEATSILTSDSPFYKNVGRYEYNLEMAKQTLADAGFNDGDITLHICMMNTPFYKTLTEGFQFYASQIGINVTTEFTDQTTALSKWQEKGTSDAGWYNDPFGSIVREPYIATLSPLTTPTFTWTKIEDEYFLEKSFEALYTVKQDERIAIYHDLQQYIFDNYLAVPLYETPFVIGYSTEVFTEQDIKDYVFTGGHQLLQALAQAR